MMGCLEEIPWLRLLEKNVSVQVNLKTTILELELSETKNLISFIDTQSKLSIQTLKINHGDRSQNGENGNKHVALS